jgi:uncharacterized protein with HEPN domain
MKDRDFTDYIRDILISMQDVEEFTMGITLRIF